MKYPIVKYGSVQAQNEPKNTTSGSSVPGGYLVENKRGEEHRQILIVRSYLTTPTLGKIIKVIAW